MIHCLHLRRYNNSPPPHPPPPPPLPVTENIDVNILGLNVCGLYSKLKYNVLQKFTKENDFDILCLSETRTDHIDLAGTSLNEYSYFIKEKTVNTHRYGGVHGLCMIIKDKFKNHAQVLTDTQSPYVLWVKFNKEAFGFGFILGSAYIPGETSTHKDKDKKMYKVIDNDITNLKICYNLPICLMGDLNSRTGTLNDTLPIESSIINNCELNYFAHELFDIAPPYNPAIMSEDRYNKDNTVNDNGNFLIDF